MVIRPDRGAEHEIQADQAADVRASQPGPAAGLPYRRGVIAADLGTKIASGLNLGSGSKPAAQTGDDQSAPISLARIRLLPRVFDGEANVWPRVWDTGRGEALTSQFGDPDPRGPVLLTPPPKRASP